MFPRYRVLGNNQAFTCEYSHELRRQELLPLVECHRLWVRFARDYIAAHHEFAEQDSGAHQVELMFECQLAPGCAPDVGDAPDVMQTGVAWVELAALGRCRFYPRAVGDILAAGIPSEGARYLGDVN